MNILGQNTVANHNETSVDTMRLFRVGHDPFVDWMWILVVSFLCAITFLAIGIMAYSSVNEAAYGDVGIISTPAHSASLDTVSLTKVKASFDARKNSYNSLLHGYDGPKDPSL